MSEPQPPRLQRMLSPDAARDGDGDERAGDGDQDELDDERVAPREDLRHRRRLVRSVGRSSARMLRAAVACDHRAAMSRLPP